MIELAPETERLIRDRAARAGQSPDALVRAAVAAYPASSQGGDAVMTRRRKGVAALLARFDAMPRRPEARTAREVLDEAWSG